MKADFFSIKFLETLPDDQLDALEILCEEFSKFDRVANKKPEFNDDYVEVLSILQAFTRHRKIDGIGFPDVTSPNKNNNIHNVCGVFGTVGADVSIRKTVRRAKGHFNSKTEHYSAIFSGISAYEFSDEDYKRIQILINELRELIVKNTFLGEDRKSVV